MNSLLIVKYLLNILADRVLVIVSLFLNFALFAFAVIYPDYIRFATAGLFSITVFIPVLKLKTGAHAEQMRQEEAA